jgi:hypothetical protein
MSKGASKRSRLVQAPARLLRALRNTTRRNEHGEPKAVRNAFEVLNDDVDCDEVEEEEEGNGHKQDSEEDAGTLAEQEMALENPSYCTRPPNRLPSFATTTATHALQFGAQQHVVTVDEQSQNTRPYHRNNFHHTRMLAWPAVSTQSTTDYIRSLPSWRNKTAATVALDRERHANFSNFDQAEHRRTQFYTGPRNNMGVAFPDLAPGAILYHSYSIPCKNPTKPHQGWHVYQTSDGKFEMEKYRYCKSCQRWFKFEICADRLSFRDCSGEEWHEAVRSRNLYELRYPFDERRFQASLEIPLHRTSRPG